MFEAPHSALLCNILKHAINTPDKIALVEGERRVTYAQLSAKIASCASYLQSLGLHCGDRIVLSAQKEQEFIYIYFVFYYIVSQILNYQCHLD